VKHRLFDKVYPYTYYIRRKSDGLQYYGSRYANVSMGISPIDDLGKRYYSSGKFKTEFSLNPSNFEIKICNTFDSVDECLDHEHKVLSKIYKRISWINANKNHFPTTVDLSIPRKKSMLLKYGLDHNFKLEKVKADKKLTFLKNYGVDNPTKSPIVMDRVKKTNLEKFGTDWSFQSDDIKGKIRESFIKKYGVDHPLKNIDVINKVKNTNFKKYGVEHVFQSQSVIDKIHIRRKEMYLRFAKMSDIEFDQYLLTISKHPSVQSQKKAQRNKGIELLNNSGGVL